MRFDLASRKYRRRENLSEKNYHLKLRKRIMKYQ
jgi:hypothetical protein